MKAAVAGGDGGSAVKSTPRKRTKATPKKNKDSGDSDDEEETPSKKPKTFMNKVKDGRVAKPRGKTNIASYAEDDDEEDLAVKGEDAQMELGNGSVHGYEVNGYGNGYVNGYGNGYDMGHNGEEAYYDANDDQP